MAHFFFGTLKDRDVLALVIGRPLDDADVAGAVLAGYRLVRVVDDPYPAPVPDAGAAIDGIVVHGLGRAEVERLAWFEGYEFAPHRVAVTPTGGGAPVEALIQAPTAALEIAGEDGDFEAWDFEAWRRDEKALLMTLTRGHMALHGRASLDEAVRIWDETREKLAAAPRQELSREG